MVVLEGGAVSYERGTTVAVPPPREPRTALRGLSRPHTWSRYLVLGAIYRQKLSNLQKLTFDRESKGLAWMPVIGADVSVARALSIPLYPSRSLS